jgi:hypothetical protein
LDQKSKRYRERHPERVKARQERWRAAHPAYKKEWNVTHREYYREKQKLYRTRRPELTRARAARYRAKHAEQEKARWKEYRDSHVEERRINSQRWHAANKDRAHALNRSWRAEHPDRVAAAAIRRRSRFKEVINNLKDSEWESIKFLYQYRCAYCGKRLGQRCNVTMDHLDPIIRGGPHTASNVVPACKACNSRKGTRSARSFQPLLFTDSLGTLMMRECQLEFQF